MITFREGQTKIYIGKNKVMPSSYGLEYIDLHLICEPDAESGYVIKSVIKSIETITAVKFVRIITFENHILKNYDMEMVKNNLNSIPYWENGGYAYDKKTF